MYRRLNIKSNKSTLVILYFLNLKFLVKCEKRNRLKLRYISPENSTILSVYSFTSYEDPKMQSIPSEPELRVTYVCERDNKVGFVLIVCKYVL